eukprot:gene7802-biopygen4184
MVAFSAKASRFGILGWSRVYTSSAYWTGRRCTPVQRTGLVKAVHQFRILGVPSGPSAGPILTTHPREKLDMRAQSQTPLPSTFSLKH